MQKGYVQRKHLANFQISLILHKVIQFIILHSDVSCKHKQCECNVLFAVGVRVGSHDPFFGSNYFLALFQLKEMLSNNWL